MEMENIALYKALEQYVKDNDLTKFITYNKFNNTFTIDINFTIDEFTLIDYYKATRHYK